MNKAVFLDKDGTIVENIPYNIDPHKITICEGVYEGLKLLKREGYIFIVVTNQDGIAHGYFSRNNLDVMIDSLNKIFSEMGTPLQGFYFCPHHPKGQIMEYKIVCQCRKPNPGLLISAAQEKLIDLRHSWLIGDILNDIEAAHLAGCKAILIDNGNETEWDLQYLRNPDYTVKNFYEAAKIISSKNSCHNMG